MSQKLDPSERERLAKESTMSHEQWLEYKAAKHEGMYQGEPPDPVGQALINRLRAIASDLAIFRRDAKRWGDA